MKLMELKNKISHFMDLVKRDNERTELLEYNYEMCKEDMVYLKGRFKELEGLVFEEWFKEYKREAWIDGVLKDLFKVIRDRAIDENGLEGREKFCEEMAKLMEKSSLTLGANTISSPWITTVDCGAASNSIYTANKES
jgi:hypothetical protein